MAMQVAERQLAADLKRREKVARNSGVALIVARAQPGDDRLLSRDAGIELLEMARGHCEQMICDSAHPGPPKHRFHNRVTRRVGPLH